MKRLVLAVLLCGVFAQTAKADGALAVVIPDGGLHIGFAYAWKVRAANADEARKEALAECREAAKKNKLAPSCKVVEVFRKSCVAVAIDAKGQWAGWGVGADEKAAGARALRQCKVGGSSCKVAEQDCDK